MLKHLPIVLLLISTACAQPQPEAAPDSPFRHFTRDWRDDRVWFDGKAECAVYDAVRVIYGKERQYKARLFTNKEYASAETKTKSATGKGRAVFKHHLREDIPTENYHYHFSTMVYVGTNDLKSLKIDMGSQEDCGATFKQFINHAGTLNWAQFSYFPDEGRKEGSYEPGSDLTYQDALSLVLRGYPFDDPRDIALALVPDQTDTHLTEARPLSATVTYIGREGLDLPNGHREAHHLTVTCEQGVPRTMHYWFDAEDDLRRIMLKYSDDRGYTLELASVERRAYWE